tara:strand:+ start:187 stop:753 length:567 start_codon:yes stop_codon:yes gene_type:complete
MNKEVIKFRNSIFVAGPRTYGEVFMEPIIRKIRGLFESDTDENDAVNDNGEFEEIKCSKVLLRIKKNNKTGLHGRIMSQDDNYVLNRLIPFDDCYTTKYLSNIQNVKRDHFSKLVYGMLFEDCLKIFESDREDISNIPRWSDKHGRFDELGKSGQFGITHNNIGWHLKNNLVATLTWEEVCEITEDIS